MLNSELLKPPVLWSRGLVLMQRLLPPRCSDEKRPEAMVLLHRPSTEPPCLTDRVAELSVSGRGRMGRRGRGGITPDRLVHLQPERRERLEINALFKVLHVFSAD
ncbi:hypothetical protein NQZ68_022371 [Dissostichus eleginoides]|nr:hypothetical protein NQZ68_022371 [Dissostichus eleginoides]